MNEVLTVELPEELARRARALAAATNRRVEEAIVEWIGRAVEEPDVAGLADQQLLALCDLTLEKAEQEELSLLLEKQREGQIQAGERQQLEHLLDLYRRGLLLKARALQEATTRGLRPRLDDHAA
jgi:hypothetical protein